MSENPGAFVVALALALVVVVVDVNVNVVVIVGVFDDVQDLMRWLASSQTR